MLGHRPCQGIACCTLRQRCTCDLGFSQEDGSAFADDEILEFVRNLMIAGRDTTATVLTWCIYLLSTHPDVEARVLEEMQREIGDATPTADNVVRLEYTKRVLMETLRLYPPGGCSCGAAVGALGVAGCGSVACSGRRVLSRMSGVGVAVHDPYGP